MKVTYKKFKKEKLDLNESLLKPTSTEKEYMNIIKKEKSVIGILTPLVSALIKIGTEKNNREYIQVANKLKKVVQRHDK